MRLGPLLDTAIQRADWIAHYLENFTDRFSKIDFALRSHEIANLKTCTAEIEEGMLRFQRLREVLEEVGSAATANASNWRKASGKWRA